MAEEHPVEQPIREIDIYIDADGDLSYFKVGRNGVTRIEACFKSGLHANIPYVRVWKDDVCEAEFCQHQIVGVYFEPPPAEAVPARTRAEPFHADCPGCDECLPF